MAYIISWNLLPKMQNNISKVQYLWVIFLKFFFLYIKMDDWYVTNALLNGTQTVYFDISPHFISTNTIFEIENLLKIKRNYSPIFAHFRPNSKF